MKTLTFHAIKCYIMFFKGSVVVDISLGGKNESTQTDRGYDGCNWKYAENFNSIIDIIHRFQIRLDVS
jgi:hypothetical protein